MLTTLAIGFDSFIIRSLVGLSYTGLSQPFFQLLHQTRHLSSEDIPLFYISPWRCVSFCSPLPDSNSDILLRYAFTRLELTSVDHAPLVASPLVASPLVAFARLCGTTSAETRPFRQRCRWVAQRGYNFRMQPRRRLPLSLPTSSKAVQMSQLSAIWVTQGMASLSSAELLCHFAGRYRYPWADLIR